MTHNVQAGLISAGQFLGGVLVGSLIQNLYSAWKNR